MKNSVLILSALIIGFTSCFGKETTDSQKKTVTISNAVLKNKIKGAWTAQAIGVTFGVPVEFKYNSSMIHDYRPLEWNDSSFSVEFRERPGTYDDIYMDLSFMNVIEQEGIDAPAESFAKSFATADYKLWFANQSARYNIQNGLKPPASGHWLNNPCADDIDFQIESDFIGLMSPGMVNSAVEICDKVGHIMNYGDGYYGGVYVAALYSEALLSYDVSDIENIVKKALSVIPPESKFAGCISDVVKWHEENPDDWKSTWFKTSQKWGEDIGSPLGVFEPFNIDAKINAAWVTIGLLYGDGDFTRTYEISTRCGDDADCNPGTAGGVLASITGYDAIPEFWLQGLDEVKDTPFMGTSISLNDAIEMSYKHAKEMIRRNGGEVKEDQLVIKLQEPETIPLEVSFKDHYPVYRVIPRQTNDRISFEFEGIGFALAAPPNIKDRNYTYETRMYIDGKLAEEVSLPTQADKRRFTPFWKYQLEPGKHKVVIEILNPLENARPEIKYAVIYDNKPKEKRF